MQTVKLSPWIYIGFCHYLVKHCESLTIINDILWLHKDLDCSLNDILYNAHYVSNTKCNVLCIKFDFSSTFIYLIFSRWTSRNILISGFYITDLQCLKSVNLVKIIEHRVIFKFSFLYSLLSILIITFKILIVLYSLN